METQTTTEPTPTPLAAATTKCVETFNLLVRSLETPSQKSDGKLSISVVKNQRDRLRIWATNIVVLGHGKASLDVEMTGSSLTKITILNLLTDLDATLLKSIEVVKGDRAPLEQTIESDSEDGSENSSESNSSSDGSYFGRYDMRTELGQNTADVDQTLSSLGKIALRIRGPVFQTRQVNKKAIEHEERLRVEDQVDGQIVERVIDLFGAYSDFDQRHVNEFIWQLQWSTTGKVDDPPLPPGTPDGLHSREPPHYLTQRWGISITTRRRILAYWRRRARTPSVTEAIPQPTPVNVHDLPFPTNKKRRLMPSSSQEDEAPNSSKRTLLPETDLSSDYRKADDVGAVLTTSSVAIRLDDDNSPTRFPSPPALEPEQTTFVCHYCNELCTSECAEGGCWREHLLQDLQPYMCTYPDCKGEEASKIYATRSAWLEHELQSHRRIWHCFEHQDKFKTRATWIDHMATSHTTFTEAQIQNMSEFAYEDAKDEREQCPFCLSSSLGDVDLASHMALHMERLASFALPRTQGTDEPDSSQVSYRRDAQDGLDFMPSLRSVSLRFSDEETDEETLGSPRHVEDEFQNYAAITEDTGSSDDGVRQDGPTVLTDDEVAYRKYRYQRYPGTCQWFMDSEKYRMWTDNEGDSFLVLGAPAVGKSVLASAVIEDLYAEARRVAPMGIILGVVGLFCERHAYGGDVSMSLHRSLIKQLLHALPGNLVSPNEGLFEAEEDDILLSQGTRRELLVRAARRMSRIFVVVDAPELLGNHQEFLQSISDLQNYDIMVNLLITSRSVPVGFGWHTHTTTIRATYRDISRFVRGSLKANPPSAPLDGILKQTVDFANGLFLFAKIYLDHLNASTRTNNEDSFDPNSSTPLVKLYTDAMIRVRMSPLSEWATTLIAWMALSESSLRLDKRAFEDLCTFRNSKSCPPTNLNLEAVISSCAGLVVVDSEGYLDFFHGTAKSFFASDRDYWFPSMAREQAETCCEYLSMEAFGSGPCQTDFRWDERMVMHPFYIHAATSWGKYARKALDQERSSRDPRVGETMRRAITTFLSLEKAVQAAMQVVVAVKGVDSNAPEWDQVHDRLSVQVATYFELTEIVDMLLLLEAAKTRKLSEVRRLLKQGTHVHGFGPDSPLRSAILNGHKDVVGVLLEYGTDANFGSSCEYPLDWAMDMEGEIGDITRLLLDYGADPTKIRTNLLSFAVRDEDMNMAKLLIGKGVDVNAADESRWTALHFAAMNGLLDFVLILLKHLPVATAADLMGRTPLDYAEQNGKEAVVRRLRKYMHETI